MVWGSIAYTAGVVKEVFVCYNMLMLTGTLLIQSEKHGIEELLALNTRYQVIRTNLYQGKIRQVILS